jgi:hypothetical protein
MNLNSVKNPRDETFEVVGNREGLRAATNADKIFIGEYADEKHPSRHFDSVRIARGVYTCANRNTIARADCDGDTIADCNSNQHSRPNGNADYYTNRHAYSDIHAFWHHLL